MSTQEKKMIEFLTAESLQGIFPEDRVADVFAHAFGDEHKAVSVLEFAESLRVVSVVKVKALVRREVLTEKELRLFACACAREASSECGKAGILLFPQSIAAIKAGEKYARGESDKFMLKEVYREAFRCVRAVQRMHHVADIGGLNLMADNASMYGILRIAERFMHTTVAAAYCAHPDDYCAAAGACEASANAHPDSLTKYDAPAKCLLLCLGARVKGVSDT